MMPSGLKGKRCGIPPTWSPCPPGVRFREAGSRRVGTWGWRREMGDPCLKGPEAQFGKMESSGHDGGDGCATWRHLLPVNCTLKSG